MDHMMPIMDGIETTNKIRAMGYRGVVVALTANAIAGSEEMFRQNGFDDFISKPIDLKELNRVLNQYVRDRHKEEALLQRQAAAANPTRSPLSPGNGVNPKLLRVFHGDAEKALLVLSDTLREKDWKLFTTTAHAMKSACANVGETRLSALAKELEDGGNAKDQALLEEKTPIFLELLKVYLDKATASNPANSASAGSPEAQSAEPTQDAIAFTEQDRLLWKDKVAALANACEEYDESLANSVLTELESLPQTTETTKLLESISSDLLHSDFEDVVETCHQMMEGILGSH
jgi:HPt (histidine-containing phosphotransfer) domain-containing protein